MIPEDTRVEALWQAERQVAGDFRGARLRARLGLFRGWLAGWISVLKVCCEYLACFAGERQAFGKVNGTEREFETVELERIVGSVGRGSSFDGRFLPLCSCSKDRWKRVDEAFHDGKPLPPVELYKLGERYFVYDGNHRVSVARYHGVVAVDALVRRLIRACGC